MKLSDIHTENDLQRYCEGLSNDISIGVIPNDQGALLIGCLAIASHLSSRRKIPISELVKEPEYSHLNKELSTGEYRSKNGR